MNMTETLKTHSLLEILEQTFRVYRDNFLTSVILVSVVTIPIAIINFILGTSSAQKLGSVTDLNQLQLSSGESTTICISALISVVLVVVQLVFTNGPITYIASEALFGRKVTLPEALQARRERFTTLGWGFLLFYVIGGAFAFSILAFAAVCAPALVFIGAIVFVGITLYAFLPPVLVLENVTLSLGLNRAWALGKARIWTVLGALLILLIVTFLVGWAFQTVIGLVLAQPLNNASPITTDLIDTLVGVFINIFLVPLVPIGMTLLYYDTRLRLEGLDTALQTAPQPGARPHQIESPLPQPGLTSSDWRNLIIITLGTLAVAVLAGTLMAPVIDKLMPGLLG